MTRKSRRRAKSDSDVVITTLPSGEREFVVDPKAAAQLTTTPVEVIETKAEMKTAMGESSRRGGSHFGETGPRMTGTNGTPISRRRSRGARKERAKQVVIDRILTGKAAISHDAIFDLAYDLAHEDGLKSAAEEARDILDRADRYAEERMREADRIFAGRIAKAYADMPAVIEPAPIDFEVARQNALRTLTYSSKAAVEAEPIQPIALDAKELASIVESKIASSAIGRKGVWPVATAPEVEVIGPEGPARNRRIVINH
jgi:hypothetical protein